MIVCLVNFVIDCDILCDSVHDCHPVLIVMSYEVAVNSIAEPLKITGFCDNCLGGEKKLFFNLVSIILSLPAPDKFI